MFQTFVGQLSRGIYLHEFDSKILKALGYGIGKGWYIPNDDAITHLIGMLDQNNLIERYDEEYQCMVPEVNYYVDAGLPKHLERGTKTKYYLSPLGRRVLQQLRQQSIPHTKGSKSK